MKKLFTILAIALCSTLAMAQTNQYFWAGGQFIMGNPIGQIDSVTFGELEQTDSVLLYLPRTVKVVHDTIIKYVTIHDTICPDQQKWQDGVLPGEFSVSATQKVKFAQGNLQYQASTGIWRFAAEQWSYVGDATKGNVYQDSIKSDNTKISNTYSGWIDLFGWGTGDNPTKNTGVNKDYSTYVDWSINSIEGSNASWTTLSQSEWEYIISNRPNAVNLRAPACIEGVNGAILLPDNSSTTIHFTTSGTGFSRNTYTLQEWQILEEQGAVFLPVAGWAHGLRNVNECGNYWTSTPDTQIGAYQVAISDNGIYTQGFIGRNNGESIRLATYVK